MSSPTGPDQNYPQGGAPQGQPGWGAPQQPSQGYSPAPSYSGPPAGYGAPGGQRPGMATAAGVIGIVWGGLGALFGLLALSVAFALSAVLGLILLVSLALSVGLLVGGIQVVTNKSPKLLLYISYVAVAINLLSLIVSIAQDGGNAFSGVLGFILPGVVIALLLQAQVKQFYASRGMGY
jgi:hypothetical protein